MVDGMKWLRRFLLPIGLAGLALMVFSGCDAQVEVRRGHYYSGHVWHSDPYCRYGYAYGCNYYNNGDRGRIRIIFNRRHNRRWGRHHMMAATFDATAKSATWQSEFNLSNRAAGVIKNAFNNALEGHTELLGSLGFNRSDMRSMVKFNMPSQRAVASASQTLGVQYQDLSDFLEVFMLRMKSAYQANESYQ
jgi:hypothetical protein